MVTVLFEILFSEKQVRQVGLWIVDFWKLFYFVKFILIITKIINLGNKLFDRISIFLYN